VLYRLLKLNFEGKCLRLADWRAGWMSGWWGGVVLCCEKDRKHVSDGPSFLVYLYYRIDPILQGFGFEFPPPILGFGLATN
jgi:hypothetical protein